MWLAEKSLLHKPLVFHHDEHLRHANNDGMASIHAGHISGLDNIL
jgi:hypothetical protein